MLRYISQFCCLCLLNNVTAAVPRYSAMKTTLYVSGTEQLCTQPLSTRKLLRFWTESLKKNKGQEYFAECGLRNAECWPRVFCGMWDAEKTCGMRYNLRNEKMRKSHLTAYKLSSAWIATIYIPNTSSAVVSASDILIVNIFKYLVVQKISGVQRSCF